MTDTPIPDTASSTDPTPRPKRPWTILGRLSKAVREQNWFFGVKNQGAHRSHRGGPVILRRLTQHAP